MKAFRNFLTTALLAFNTVFFAAGADITHTLLGLQITNYTGYVIDADALSPLAAYNREHILVQSRVETTNSSGLATFTEHYLRFRLLNSAGQPHPLYDSSGIISPNATYNLTNAFGLGSHLAVLRTNVAALRPAARLNPWDRYTVEANLYTPGSLIRAGTLTNTPQTFRHFTNLVSNDPNLNVIAELDGASFTRAYAVQTDPDRNSFHAAVDYALHRYDNFSGAIGPVDNVSVTLNYQLVNAATGVAVPLVNNSTNFNLQLFKHTEPPAPSPVGPWVQQSSRTVRVQPASGNQLNSVDANYRLIVSVSHLEQTGIPSTSRMGSTNSSPSTRLLHFNGVLRFGELEGHFESIDNDPAPGLVQPGSHVFSTLSVDSLSGTIPSLPGVTFGDGTNITVRLQANGDAVSHDDDLPINLAPGGTLNVQNVRMQLVAPAALTPTGLISGIRVYLPTGLGYRRDRAGHILHRSFVVNSVPLGHNLRPLDDVTFTSSTALQMVDEGKPLWMATSTITWRVDEGRFDWVPNPGGLAHVRFDEYARLSALHNQLNNSERSLKRSNDRYFDVVQSNAGSIVAAADANGVAQLTASFILGSKDFRSHFPYDVQVAWAGGGTLNITNDVVPAGSSQLAGVQSLGLNYDTGCNGVDCGPDATLRAVRLIPAGGILQFTLTAAWLAVVTWKLPTDSAGDTSTPSTPTPTRHSRLVRAVF